MFNLYLQYNLIEDEDKQRVLFTSTYGTGKTILMKAKIRQLQGKGKNTKFTNKNNYAY
jgi:hypothetical protein